MRTTLILKQTEKDIAPSLVEADPSWDEKVRLLIVRPQLEVNILWWMSLAPALLRNQTVWVYPVAVALSHLTEQNFS